MPDLTRNEIQLTDRARERFLALVLENNDALGLRLSIKRGKGCAGNEYSLDLVDEATRNEQDFRLAVGEYGLYVPVADLMNFLGMQVDFGEDHLGNERFIFNNPNESGACGCGVSVAF